MIHLILVVLLENDDPYIIQYVLYRNVNIYMRESKETNISITQTMIHYIADSKSSDHECSFSHKIKDWPSHNTHKCNNFISSFRIWIKIYKVNSIVPIITRLVNLTALFNKSHKEYCIKFGGIKYHCDECSCL